MKFFTAVLACAAILGAFAESRHPCVYFRAGELPSLREMDVLKWLAQWKSREETSIILGIGLETVNTHAKSILQKLEVQNTAGAITRAFELGLLLRA